MFNKSKSEINNITVKINNKRCRSWFGLRWYIKNDALVFRHMPKGQIVVEYDYIPEYKARYIAGVCNIAKL